MALLLRQACQPVLNAFDMDAFHADLKAKTGRNELNAFAIFDNCGRTFCLVQGITFGRSNPTKAEINFATELLKDWLERKKSIITNYLTVLETLQKIGVPPKEVSLKNFQITCIVDERKYWDMRQNYRLKTCSLVGVQITFKGWTSVLTNKMEVYKVYRSDDKAPVQPFPFKYTVDQYVLKAAKKVMDNYSAYLTANSELTQIQRTLNTCEV